jgi:hypothetical protein
LGSGFFRLQSRVDFQLNITIELDDIVEVSLICLKMLAVISPFKFNYVRVVPFPQTHKGVTTSWQHSFKAK